MPAGVRVERLVETEPVLLDVQISTVLQEIRRLLPAEDPRKVHACSAFRLHMSAISASQAVPHGTCQHVTLSSAGPPAQPQHCAGYECVSD